MQGFGPDMRIAAQHLPVHVAGDESDLSDGEAHLKEATCASVAQVMEMQVFDNALHAGALEGRSDRPRVVGKDPPVGVTQMLGLRRNQRPDVEPGGCEERNSLFGPGLVARVLTVEDQEHPAVDIEIAPFDAADLVEPHGRGYRELHNPRHGQGQAFVVIEATEQAVQLVRAGGVGPARFACR